MLHHGKHAPVPTILRSVVGVARFAEKNRTERFSTHGSARTRTAVQLKSAWESHRRRRISPAIGGHEGSRPEDSRHSWRSRRTPTPSCSGLWREDEWRLPCHGTNSNMNKTKTFQNEKTKRGEWAPLTVRSGLLSRCTHEGGTGTGTRRRGRKLK